MAGHARLSASSAHRWLECPGSVNASAGRESRSEAAAAGTFAHDIAAKCLNDQSVSPSDFLLQERTIDGFVVKCDLEMVEAVRFYVDTIDEDRQDGDLLWVEMPLLDALQKIDPDFGGTADLVRYRQSARSLRVTDFKFGAGVYVESEDNPQLKKYALGAMLQVDLPVEEVEVAIVQPRFEGAAPFRSFKFKAYELLDFIVDLQEAARLSRLPNAPLKAGDWCKFCPAARDCKELKARQDALVKAEFHEVVDYKQLAETLAAIPLVKERIKAIEAFAYTEALAGRFGEAHGYKVVDKRPMRKWKSEGDVVEWAQANGIDPWEKTVISPAAMEEKLKANAPRGKKKEAAAAMEPLVEKVSSGTVLVPVSDNRPPAQLVTKDDFAVIAEARG